MFCLEVFLNGEKICTAGVGDFGLVSAKVIWISHEPEKLARWAAEGRPERPPVSLDLTVSGLVHDDEEEPEHLGWADECLSIGDEIRIRAVDLPEPDGPVS